MAELSPYKGNRLPADTRAGDLAAIVSDYETMVVTVMRAIVERQGRWGDYPFVNTKLDLVTGEDFPEDDPIKGKGAIYGWIQGRALESLVGHAKWLQRRGIGPDQGIGDDLIPQLDQIIRGLAAALQDIRARHAGRLRFFMTPEGNPFVLDADGLPTPAAVTDETPYGFTDIFGCKGLLAAAAYLDDQPAFDEAMDYCLAIDSAIHDWQFENDQVSLDPKNPTDTIPGKHPHGPYMIQIGTAALLAGLGKPESVEMGLRLIRYELENHVNVFGRIPKLKAFDFWENIDEGGRPYEDDGKIVSDPGHALECVGLILKFTSAVKANGLADGQQDREIAEIERLMPRILERNFQNGYRPGPGGVVKGFDLKTRETINSDMPWWPLPETMRSAAFCYRTCDGDGDREMCLGVLRDCHNAFVDGYVRPDLNLMAYQTRDENGQPVPVIPASADADPGYHTGLSIIDMLDVIEGLRKQS